MTPGVPRAPAVGRPAAGGRRPRPRLPHADRRHQRRDHASSSRTRRGSPSRPARSPRPCPTWWPCGWPTTATTGTACPTDPEKGTSMTASTTARPSSRVAVLDRETAMRLAATEYGRFASLLRTLAPGDWARPTDCPAWDVRAMAGHVLGMAQMVAAVRSLRRAERGGGPGRWGHRRPDRGAGPEDGAALRRRTRRPVRRRRTAGGARPAPAGRRARALHAAGGPGRRRAARSGGPSATSSTSSSPGTPGCTGSTSAAPSGASWS